MRLKVLLLSLLVGFNLFAQTDPLTLNYAVSGTVTDSQDNHPLQFVVVTIPGLRIATVTNADGGFIIKSPTRPQALEFTLLGYRTTRVDIEPGENNVKVKMLRNDLTLNESVVISGDPYAIMEEAVRKIRDNYPSYPELYDCFYRETIQKRSRYVFISEAVSRLYKTSYKRETLDGDRVTVDKSRILMSPNSKDTLSVKVVGGPTQAVDLDFVKNNDLLSRSDLVNYVLKMESPEMIGDRYQFAIRVIPAKETPYPLYEGLVYIDRETFAFTRFDLHLDMSDADKVTRTILISKPAGL
ncbi:MAG: carboxypeptidase-like regulatory domain-containing protein, partial [Bacteroidales bacterium]|nr:carboxypeptidase-like regulatory domain-containing protein [Bacteroidales bacterium]